MRAFHLRNRISNSRVTVSFRRFQKTGVLWLMELSSSQSEFTMPFSELLLCLPLCAVRQARAKTFFELIPPTAITSRRG